LAPTKKKDAERDKALTLTRGNRMLGGLQRVIKKKVVPLNSEKKSPNWWLKGKKRRRKNLESAREGRERDIACPLGAERKIRKAGKKKIITDGRKKKKTNMPRVSGTTTQLG